jgi:hypothetical protein
MIHACIVDSRGHTTTRNFADTDSIARWTAVQKRQHRGLAIAETAPTPPTLFDLEARAREYVVRITRCPKGYQWTSAKDGAGYFDSRQDALRDAFECGELGE